MEKTHKMMMIFEVRTVSSLLTLFFWFRFVCLFSWRVANMADEEKVQTMIALGFTEEQARHALQVRDPSALKSIPPLENNVFCSLSLSLSWFFLSLSLMSCFVFCLGCSWLEMIWNGLSRFSSRMIAHRLKMSMDTNLMLLRISKALRGKSSFHHMMTM